MWAGKSMATMGIRRGKAPFAHNVADGTEGKLASGVAGKLNKAKPCEEEKAGEQKAASSCTGYEQASRRE